MPNLYRSQHAGTIADLMRQQGQSAAEAVRMQGQAEAQRAHTSGQAWGGAIQGIANTVTGTLRDYAQQRADEPRRQLMGRQSDMIAKQLEQMDAQEAQAKLGQLAQMALASPDDVELNDTVAGTMARLSPEFADPIMQARQNPESWPSTLQTILTQMPGYKAPGTRQIETVGPDGKPVTQIVEDRPGQSFAVPPPPPSNRAPTQAELALLAAGTGPEAEQAQKALELMRPPAQGPAVGTFEDYVVRKHGASPTPQQVATARREWAALDRAPERPERPGWQWVIRNGQPVEIRQGQAQPGDVPTTAAAEGRRVQEAADVGEVPFIPEEDRLWNRLGLGTTGPLSSVAAVVGEITPFFQDTIADRQAFSSNTQSLIRSLAENPRFPVAEQERIRREVNIQPRFWTGTTAIQTRMREIDKYLAQLADRREKAGDQASVFAIEQFRRQMGVPQEGSDSGGGDAVVEVEMPDGSVKRFRNGVEIP